MKKWPWFLLALLVIVVDQVTKHWATVNLLPYEPEPIMPMLNFTLAYNTGAAFSFLSTTGAWHGLFFVGFSVLMSLVLIIWMLRLSNTDKLQAFSLSLILGGALGNLIDRLTFGKVVDFIDVYYQHHHWPIFNIADTAICIGAVLLFLDLWRQPVAKKDN